MCGNPELVEDRVNGRTFDFQDHEAIAAAVSDLLADPERTAGYVQRSREKVADFAPETIFARKERLFASVAGIPLSSSH